MAIDVLVLKGTTDASGDAVITSEVPVRGYLHAVAIKGTSLDAGADWTFTRTKTPSEVDVNFLVLTNVNSNITRYVRELEHSNVGGNLTTYTRPVLWGNVKLTIAQGGNAKAFIAALFISDVP